MQQYLPGDIIDDEVMDGQEEQFGRGSAQYDEGAILEVDLADIRCEFGRRIGIPLPATVEAQAARLTSWLSAQGLMPGASDLSGVARQALSSVGRVTASPLKELVITDSIQATEAVRLADNIRQLTVAPLMAEAISRISVESSVSSLFA